MASKIGLISFIVFVLLLSSMVFPSGWIIMFFVLMTTFLIPYLAFSILIDKSNSMQGDPYEID